MATKKITISFEVEADDMPSEEINRYREAIIAAMGWVQMSKQSSCSVPMEYKALLSKMLNDVNN